MRLWKYMPAVAALALAGVIVAPAAPTSAAVPTVKINGKTSLPNTKAGAVVTITGTGWPANDANLIAIECSAGSDMNGSGCDLAQIVSTPSDGSGNIGPVSYTLAGGALGSDTTLHCLPPTAANIKAGLNCGIIVVDSMATTTRAIANIFDKLGISTALSGGNVTVTCTKANNVTNMATPPTITHEKVDFFKNGVKQTTVVNVNGTVKGTFAAAAGDKVQCKGELFKQTSATKTL
jgi:hypothetical protein